jgi:hypothetical protein
MKPLVAYQREFIDLLFRKDFAKSLASLSTDPKAEQRFRVYRRMARHRLTDVIENSFPRLRVALGDLDPMIERWFDEAPPRSPYIRDIAGEFAKWLSTAELANVPPWASELAAFEWATLDVQHAHEEEGAEDVRVSEIGELDFERPAILTPAHRILRTRYAVHRIPEDVTGIPEVEEGAFTLCIYRDPASHEPRVLELSPIAAAIIEEVRSGDRTVVEAVRAASERVGFAIDGPFVEAFSELVADLAERGVWLGAKPPT